MCKSFDRTQPTKVVKEGKGKMSARAPASEGFVAED